MNDPLQELAEANSQRLVASRQIAACADDHCRWPAARAALEAGFARGFWITAGVLVAIFVLGMLFAGINRIIQIGQEREAEQQRLEWLRHR